MTAYYNTTLMDDTIRVKVCNCNPRQSTSHPATDASTATTRQKFALITVVTIVTVSGLRVVCQDVILVERFAVQHSHHVPSRGGARLASYQNSSTRLPCSCWATIGLNKHCRG